MSVRLDSSKHDRIHNALSQGSRSQAFLKPTVAISFAVERLASGNVLAIIVPIIATVENLSGLASLQLVHEQ